MIRKNATNAHSMAPMAMRTTPKLAPCVKAPPVATAGCDCCGRSSAGVGLGVCSTFVDDSVVLFGALLSSSDDSELGTPVLWIGTAVLFGVVGAGVG